MRDEKGRFVLGHVKTKDIREKISKGNTGRKHTEEEKKRMSKIAKERGYGKWMKGRKNEELRKRNLGKRGPETIRWKGGRYKNWGGYILVLSHDHPNKDKDGYVREHRLVMEKHLGRFLTREEVVHHIDGDCSNNDISNLQLFKNDLEHKRVAHSKSARKI